LGLPEEFVPPASSLDYALHNASVALMKRTAAPVLLVTFAAILTSCSGSGSKIMAPPMPNISGPWEFIATSTITPGYQTGIETALQEGQVFSNTTASYVETGQISASGTQLSFVGLNYLNGSSHETIVFAGNCTAASSNPGDALSGSISGLAGAMNFTYTEMGNLFTVTGMLSADGKSMVGTYTEQAAASGETNGVCNSDGTVLDQGTVAGTVVSKISGTFIGKICQPSDSSCSGGAKDNVNASLSESSGTLTFNMVLTGADNATLTLTGPVAANRFTVSGTFEGSSVSYEGYVQYVFDSVDGLYDLPSLYLANVDLTTSPPTPTYAGTLTVPPLT
jgi:hypothetical protein